MLGLCGNTVTLSESNIRNAEPTVSLPKTKARCRSIISETSTRLDSIVQQHNNTLRSSSDLLEEFLNDFVNSDSITHSADVCHHGSFVFRRNTVESAPWKSWIPLISSY